jgi:Xaa-Pro aminopeptidase
MKKKAILAEGIIISHGAQAAIPHHAGSGVLRAHESIVCDIFPRGKENFYFADMTRTFCKGTHSEELQLIYDKVKEAQEKAISMIKPGASGKTIHEECYRIFTERGFVTTREEGFTHSTGHGVGLEIHESPPRISFAECIFLPGDVVTVEPGLYYPAFGGVRIEDMVLVTEDGHRNLTQFEKILFIP